MSTMWSTCSMSTGHCSTHAPQVVQDHSTSGSMTPPSFDRADQRARRPARGPEPGHSVDRTPARRRDSRRGVSTKPPSAPAMSFARRQDVRRLGERVVAQVHDQQLGRQRLAGVPGRALRLAAAALGAGGEVEQPFQVKSSTLPRPNTASSAGILEVDRLAPGLHRQQRAQARPGAARTSTLSGATKMCRCLL